MSDLIDRQAAIDALGCCQTYLFDSRDDDKKISLEDATYAIEQLPSVQSESEEMLSGKVWDEWCTGCKEYDHEKHCCPRFNRIIRTAIDDAQPEIVRCKDCKYFSTEQCYMHIERLWELTPKDYCSQGERRGA